MWGCSCLLYAEDLNNELKDGIGGDLLESLAAIAKLWGNNDGTLQARMHELRLEHGPFPQHRA